MNIANVDTLIVTLDIDNYDSSARNLLVRLERQKQKAKASMEKIIVRIDGMGFEILPNGARHHAYILHNDFCELKLAQYRSKGKDCYPVFVKFKSEYLWSKGYRRAWKETAAWIIKNIGTIIANKISRIDLCCHTDELILTACDIAAFKGKYRSDEIYRSDRKFSGMTFGSGKNKKVHCRIYDKILEINQKRQKLWFFDVWKAQGMNLSHVWNVEFQIQRKFFKEYGIETVEDAFNRLKSMWQYCTQQWIVKVNADSSRSTRCTINKAWQSVQKAFDNHQSEQLIKKEEQLNKDIEAIVPAAIGFITSYAARRGIPDVDFAIKTLQNHGKHYLKSKEESYYAVISKKMSLMKGCEVKT